MGKFFKTWSGECSAWECDGLGHLNMRHYMTKVQQARQMFFISTGLPLAFRKQSLTTVKVKSFYIRYIDEARPDDPLYIESGCLEISKKAAKICHIMYHLDGRVASTIVENVEHINLSTETAAIWPKGFFQSAERYNIIQPLEAKLRNIKHETESWNPHESELIKISAKQIGAGVFQLHEAGTDGKITPQALMGRATETLAHMLDGYPEFRDPLYKNGENSGALLEAQIFIHKAQVAGDAYRFYSGLIEGDKYTRKIVHHIVNSVTGDCIFSMIGAGCLFNLKSRKLIKANERQVAVLQNNILDGLRI